jgi:AcrR family transcriptional regulator
LLDAAERLFRRDGYAATSLDRIAGEAGYTKGAVYSNFPNKEAVFLALDARHSERHVSAWRAALPAAASEEVRLHALGQYIAQMFVEQRDWALVASEFWALAARRADLRQAWTTTHRAARAAFAELLAEALPEAGLRGRRAGDELAVQALAMLEGLGVQAAVDPELDMAGLFSRGLAKLAAAEADHAEATSPQGRRTAVARIRRR